MKTFEFVGAEVTNVGLPDGMVVTLTPGDVVDLPYDDPSPLLRLSKKKASLATPDNLLPDTPAALEAPVASAATPVDTTPVATPEES